MDQMTFDFGGNGRTSLDEARKFVAEGRWDGVECPCCGSWVRVYHTPFPGVAARVLCDMFRAGGRDREWVHVPSCPHANHGGDALKAVHWGLIEPQEGERDDGSKRIGWWRLTERGLFFVMNAIAVPRYADIQRPSTCLGLSGRPMWISQAVGEKFNYRELMGWI